MGSVLMAVGKGNRRSSPMCEGGEIFSPFRFPRAVRWIGFPKGCRMKKLLIALSVPVMLLLTACQPSDEGPTKEPSKAPRSAKVRWDALPKSKRNGICEATLNGDSAEMLKALESAGFGNSLDQMVPVAIDECSKG